MEEVAPIPLNEIERQQDVQSLGLLDTFSESRFDRLTRLVARILNTVDSHITIVDANRLWFKSCVIDLADREASRNHGTCAYAINYPPIFIVPDMRLDRRFCDRADVLDPIAPTRAYAGAVIFGPRGTAVGTLCAIDTRPRQFTDDDIENLKTIAEIAQAEVLRSAVQMQMYVDVKRVYDDLIESITITSKEGFLLYANKQARQTFQLLEGVNDIGDIERITLVAPADKERYAAAYERAKERGEANTVYRLNVFQRRSAIVRETVYYSFDELGTEQHYLSVATVHPADE